MLIQPTLVLDHYYFSVNEQEFKELRLIFSQFSSAFHELVKSDGDQWEGLYIYTRAQNYIEFLNERRPGGVGICQKAFSPITQDARLIMQDLPHLPWKKYDRFIDGNLWFSAMSCDDYLDTNNAFNTWVTYYAQRNRKDTHPIPKYPVDRFTNILVKANPSFRQKILAGSEWFNAVKKVSAEKIEFHFQTYYSDSFIYTIEFSDSVEKFEFVSSAFLITEECEAKAVEFNRFKLEVDGRKLKLLRKS